MEDQQNEDRIKALAYHGDVANWTFQKYVLGHKDCHVVQDSLSGDHGYQNFDERDKVTWFTNGIKAGEYATVILQIRGNLNGSRYNFEKACELVDEFKQILDNQKAKRAQVRSVSEMHGGRGRGGRGGVAGGRGGGGRGGGGGRDWRFTHRTTKGSKDQLKAAKDADGGWATHRITS